MPRRVRLLLLARTGGSLRRGKSSAIEVEPDTSRATPIHETRTPKRRPTECPPSRHCAFSRAGPRILTQRMAHISERRLRNRTAAFASAGRPGRCPSPVQAHARVRRRPRRAAELDPAVTSSQYYWPVPTIARILAKLNFYILLGFDAHKTIRCCSITLPRERNLRCRVHGSKRHPNDFLQQPALHRCHTQWC